MLVLRRKNLDGYCLNCKRTRVVIRKITQPFLIIATLRIGKCGVDFASAIGTGIASPIGIDIALAIGICTTLAIGIGILV